MSDPPLSDIDLKKWLGSELPLKFQNEQWLTWNHTLIRMQNFLYNQIPVEYLESDHMTRQLRCILADPSPRRLRHSWTVRYRIFLLGHLEHHHRNIHKYTSKMILRVLSPAILQTIAVQSWTTLFGTLGGAQNFDLHWVGNGVESRVYSKQLKFSLPPAGSFVSSSHQAKHSLSSPQNIFNPFLWFLYFSVISLLVLV